MVSVAAASLVLRRSLGATSTRTTAAARCWKSTKAEPNDAKGAASLLDSASEYYTSLRWKFAANLTASLSPDERQELLDRLQVPQTGASQQPEEPQPQQQQQQQHSIAEAVAAARAEEAQQQTAKWEREKFTLLAEAEQAAKSRVENELLIQHRRLAFERWQQELEQQPADKVTTTTTNEETPAEETNKEEPVAIQDHPVLGSAIADLGYKRIHIASVAALKSLPVWKKQRTYRHGRAKTMAQDKLKTLHLGMPGVIALHEDLQGNLFIIDGQHRVGMMAILEGKQDLGSFDLKRILVEVYPQQQQDQGDTGAATNKSNDGHAQEIFLEINKAEPVKLVDLPGVRGLSKTDRKTINDGAQRLIDRFPDMFSSSQRCRAPHLNVDNLRDALFASEVIKRHGIKSSKALETWMMDQNVILKEKYTGNTSSNQETEANKSALAKAIKFDFYLGLDSSWLFQ